MEPTRYAAAVWDKLRDCCLDHENLRLQVPHRSNVIWPTKTINSETSVKKYLKS